MGNTRGRVLLVAAVMLVGVAAMSPVRLPGFGVATSGAGPDLSPIVPPDPPIITLTTGNDAGNNPWDDPAAYQQGGTVYFGYVDGSGNIEARTYAGGVVSSPTTLHATLEVDAHDSPTFLRLASGTVLAVYGKHNAGLLYRRLSTGVDTFSSWNAAGELDASLGGTRYTHYQLAQLTDETDDPVYLTLRDEPSAGDDSRWVFSKSTNGGVTWGAQQSLYRVVNQRSYLISHSNAGTIHYVVTNGSDTGYTKLGHFYYTGGKYYKSDGTEITATRPFTFTDVTTIYSGSAGVFASNIVLDGDGYPVVGAQDTIAGDIRYIYLRWDGSAWDDTNVVSAGTGYEYSGAGTGFGSYGYCIDDGAPDDFFVIREVSGNTEVWRYRTADGGDTFSGVAVTTGSTTMQTQLVCVRNPDSSLRVFWQSGTWTSYTNWNQRLLGVGDF